MRTERQRRRRGSREIGATVDALASSDKGSSQRAQRATTDTTGSRPWHQRGSLPSGSMFRRREDRRQSRPCLVSLLGKIDPRGNRTVPSCPLWPRCARRDEPFGPRQLSRRTVQARKQTLRESATGGERTVGCGSRRRYPRLPPDNSEGYQGQRVDNGDGSQWAFRGTRRSVNQQEADHAYADHERCRSTGFGSERSKQGHHDDREEQRSSVDQKRAG